MALSDSEWIQRARSALTEAGYRRGGARSEVLELIGSQQCALSAQEIETLLRQGQRRVSRASIYRALEQLEEIGVVQRIETGSPISRFEAVGPGRGHHHHVVCDECGRLEPFTDTGLERALKSLEGRLPMAVSEHEVTLHAACADCAS